MQLMEEGQKFFFKSIKNFVTNFHYGQERRKNNNNLPLGWRKLNKQVHWKKYQNPNIDE